MLQASDPGGTKVAYFRRRLKLLAQWTSQRVTDVLRTPRTRRILAIGSLAAVAIGIIIYAARVHRGIPYGLVPQSQFQEHSEFQADHERALLEKLNRADRAHLFRLSSILVPRKWNNDELTFSPLPATYSLVKSTPKLVVVDECNQVFGAYEWGRLVRWGPVSTGQQGRSTPQGLFHLTWRSRRHRSAIDHQQLAWYFNFDERRGLAFHEHPLPGYPASDGCVRLLERDAQWLYQWGTPRFPKAQGTAVLVIGQYDFRKPPPWYSTRSSSQKINLPAKPAF